MVKLISRVHENQFSLLSFVAIIGLVVSVISPSPFVNFTVVFISIFALSGVMPTNYSNLRVVYAFTYLAIGFGLYLVLRGFLIAGPISKYDFAICISLLGALALSPKYLGRKNGSGDFKPLKFSFVTGSTTLVFCLAFGTYLMSKGIGYFLAWSGSGDSRNHVQTLYVIARKGHLDLIDIGSPLLPHTLSMFLNSGSPVALGNDSSSRLLTDWTSHSLTWALLVSVLGYAFAAVWEVALPQTLKKSEFFLLAPASALALTSLSLGTFLIDGFVTATAGAISLAFATAILFERSSNSSATNLFSLFLVVTLALFSWTFIVIPVLIMMIPLYLKWLDLPSKSFWIWSRLFLTIVGVSLTWYRFTTYYADYFLSALTNAGSISAAHPKTFKILLVAIVLLAVISSKTKSPTMLQLGLVAISATSLILILNKASGIPLDGLNYYSTKAMMILFVGLLPTVLIFIPVLFRLMAPNSPYSAMRIVIACVVIGVLTHMSAQYVSPYPRMIGQINDGWQGPNANSVSQVLSLANDPLNPVVFFDYLPPETGENRLANFWLGAYADPWAYYQSWAYLGDQTGDYPAFCFLNLGYPLMTVYTGDPNLRSKMRVYCRDEKMIINVIK
ncbi:MAG: hypothetical protein RI895_142 [Actinomycetota bacterium]|jgi:hypothetical protein